MVSTTSQKLFETPSHLHPVPVELPRAQGDRQAERVPVSRSQPPPRALPPQPASLTFLSCPHWPAFLCILCCNTCLRAGYASSGEGSRVAPGRTPAGEAARWGPRAQLPGGPRGCPADRLSHGVLFGYCVLCAPGPFGIFPGPWRRLPGPPDLCLCRLHGNSQSPVHWRL